MNEVAVVVSCEAERSSVKMVGKERGMSLLRAPRLIEVSMHHGLIVRRMSE